MATHQLPGESARGGGDAAANAMLIGQVGGSCPAHAVSLHALIGCQTQQGSDNGDEPGKSKGSVLKLEVPALLLAH